MKLLLALLLLFSGLAAAAVLPNFPGSVQFNNRIVGAVDAPVTLPDGRAAGLVPGLVAQLFHVTRNGLVPCEPSTSFRIGTNPLLPCYVMAIIVSVQGTKPRDYVTLRMRVWEKTKGNTFEESQTNGGYFGESNDFTIKLGGASDTPEPLSGLQGFVLQRQK